MKELFETLQTKNIDLVLNPVLLDTCFVFHAFERHENVIKLIELSHRKNLCITSFNIEEILHNEHKIHGKVKENFRKFLHSAPAVFKVEIGVKPGEWEKEKEFVKGIDKELLMHVHDPSDGVLIAAAIRMRADILTRDKHHMYTCEMENFLKKYNIAVFNKIEM